MASGKTTFGRALAKALGLDFIDLDEYICLKTGKTIPQIFSQEGEDYFRTLESQALIEVCSSKEPAIVACGGGTPCFGDNISLMNSAGITVWLDADRDAILRRLREDCANRPLVASLDAGGELERYVGDNLSRRLPFYSHAKIRFDSSHLESAEEISNSVAEFMKILTNFGI